MKKMFVLVLVAILAVSGLCSCSYGSTSEISSTSSGNSSVSEISQTSSKPVNTVPVNSVSEPQGKITITSSDEANSLYILRGEQTFDGIESPFNEFGLAESLGFYEVIEEKEDSDLVGTSVMPNEKWGTLNYSHTEYMRKSMYSEGYGTFYSAYDVYKYHGDKVEYLKGTNIISRYKTESNISGLEEYNKSEEESRQIAEDFLLNYICSEEELAKYTYLKTEVLTTKTSCCVYYMRYALGYATDEVICIYINRDGKVWGYSNDNRMKFDLLPETLTKENLDTTAQKIKDEINTMGGLIDVTFSEPYLVTDTTGELFIRVVINYKVSLKAEKKSETLYIKV